MHVELIKKIFISSKLMNDFRLTATSYQQSRTAMCIFNFHFSVNLKFTWNHHTQWQDFYHRQLIFSIVCIVDRCDHRLRLTNTQTSLLMKSSIPKRGLQLAEESNNLLFTVKSNCKWAFFMWNPFHFVYDHLYDFSLTYVIWVMHWCNLNSFTFIFKIPP